ncbi:MAG: hypothetical protein JXB39_00620 [Deltaproteobacteria bacterium]|nr:hypothetical protein [Deltaproteobacteria bacterium]
MIRAPGRALGPWAIGAAFLVDGACRPAPDDTGEIFCDPRTLAEGEVRARRLPCDAEGISGGEGKRGDFLIENAWARFVVRHAGSSAMHLGLAGGTLLDAAPPHGEDALGELVPLPGNGWIGEGTVTVAREQDSAVLRVTGTPAPVPSVGGWLGPGTEIALTWRLGPDDRALEMEGADAAWLYPAAGATLTGPILHDDDRALAMDGMATDTGGAVLWSGAHRFAAGEASAVMAALWPGGPEAWGTAPDATGVEILEGDRVVGWLPVDESGTFEGTLPEGADGIRAVAEGVASGPVLPPGPALVLDLGDPGFLAVHASDGAGNDLGAVLEARDPAGCARRLPVPPEGADLPLGPGTWDLVLHAGPLRERVVRAGFEVAVGAALEGDLPLAGDAGDVVLADLAVETWRSRDDRSEPAASLALAAASGVRFAVTTAPDEVAGSERVQPWERIRVETGSTALTDSVGRIGAWPVVANAEKAAHGAAPWRGLDAVDALAVASGGRSRERLLSVDPRWIEAASDPRTWDPRPDMVVLEGIGDLPLYMGLLDAWMDLAAVGPWTWVAVDDPDRFSGVEVEQGLVSGRTVASSGPFLALDVAGQGPGSHLEAGGSVPVRLTVLAPSWMPLTGAALLVDGEVVARWDLAGRSGGERLVASRVVEARRWVLAAAWGTEDPGPPARGLPWAITSPVWTADPVEP